MLSELLQLKQFDAKENCGVTSNTFSVNIIKPVLFIFNRIALLFIQGMRV